MDNVQIGHFIAQRRKAAGLTQNMLAERLGITGKSVSKWENGNSLPDPSLYVPLCHQLGISIDELFAGRPMPVPPDAVKDQLIDLLVSRIYSPDCGISLEAFKHSLLRFSEAIVYLSSFASKEEAVSHLMQETGLPRQECADAYDIYLGMMQRSTHA